MGCCDDPTEPVKINRSDMVQIQEQYGNLLRDLFTEDPERLMLKQLNRANRYLIELAALNAHFNSVKKHAIELLDKKSLTILQQIADKSTDPEMSQCAVQRIEQLENEKGLLGKFFT